MRNEPERKIHPREFQCDSGREIFAAVASFFCNYDLLTLPSNLKICVPQNVKSRGELK